MKRIRYYSAGQPQNTKADSDTGAIGWRAPGMAQRERAEAVRNGGKILSVLPNFNGHFVEVEE